jgi:hypothetical protein
MNRCKAQVTAGILLSIHCPDRKQIGLVCAHICRHSVGAKTASSARSAAYAQTDGSSRLECAVPVCAGTARGHAWRWGRGFRSAARLEVIRLTEQVGEMHDE